MDQYAPLMLIQECAIARGIQQHCIESIVHSIIKTNHHSIPTHDALEDIATKYLHTSFVQSSQLYTQAQQLLQACIETCRVLLKQSTLYQTHKKQFIALFKAKSCTITQHSSKHIFVLNNDSKFSTRTHAKIFTAWWIITHPGITLLQSLQTQLGSDTETNPMSELYLRLNQTFTPSAVEAAAKQYKEHLVVFVQAITTTTST